MTAAIVAIGLILFVLVALCTLRRPVLIALIILFPASLDYVGSLIPGLLTVNNAFKILFMLLFAVRCMQVGTKIRIPRHLLDCLPFVLISGVGVFYSSQFMEAAQYWARLVFIWSFTVVISNVVRKESHLRLVAFALIAVTLLTSSLAVVQSLQLFQQGPFAIHGGEQAVARGVRVSGAFWNPNKMAVYLVGMLIILFAVYPDIKQRLLAKIGFWFTTAATLIAILLSLSRSGYLALVFGLTLFLFSRRHRRLALGTFGAGAVLLALILLFTPYQADLLERFMSFTELGEDTSGRVRTHLAASGLYIFSDGLNAIWGAGLKSFNFDMESHLHYMMSHDVYYHSGIRASHNHWITIIAEHGILGIVAILLFLRGIFRSLLRALEGEGDGLMRSFAIGLTIFILVKLFDLNFNPDFLENTLWYALGLLGAIGAIHESRATSEPNAASD